MQRRFIPPLHRLDVKVPHAALRWWRFAGVVMVDESRKTCPHCGAQLAAFGLPDPFDHPFDLACFNDECPYYVRGWAWMEQQYGVKSSYRYRIDPQNGFASPVPVWSPTALRDNILPPDALAAFLKERS